MECEICLRTTDQVQEFLCPSCARSTIYLQRLEAAQTLLQKEQLARQIQQVIQPESDATSKEDEQNREIRVKWSDVQQRAKDTRAAEALKEIQSCVDDLRLEIRGMKDQIASRRHTVSKRRDELQYLTSQMGSRRQQQDDRITEISTKGLRASKLNYDSIVEDKALFCREAAILLRLRQQQKKTKNGNTVDQYLIGGLLLPDLREINNVRCSDLTACLSSVAHLVVLVAFYIGVRLPAEITLPHRDYPLATINTPPNSYLGQKIAFPGSGAYASSTNSPATSRHEVNLTPRPRPLFLGSDDQHERIAQLAKRDSAVFGLFIEGVSLLAWDIAWLSRSQGFASGTNTWEEICNMGRGLWHLLLAPKLPPTMVRAFSNREFQNKAKPTKDHDPSVAATESALDKLGATSHTSAHGFLGNSSTPDPMRGWKVSKFNVISDSLRKALLTEMNNAEWELLEEREWDDGGEDFNDAVHIKSPTTANATGWDDARSIMTVRTHAGKDVPLLESVREDAAPSKGTSGWTKVKNRDKGSQV